MDLITFDDLLQDTLCLRVDEMVQKEGISRSEKLYRHRFVAGLIKLLVEDFIENSRVGAKKYRQETPICTTLEATDTLPVGFSKETATELKRLEKTSI